ncbi:MAG: glycosyl hydrolase [Candidatus Krumholzibacteriota bacterium]
MTSRIALPVFLLALLLMIIFTAAPVATAAADEEEESPLNASALAGLELRSIGPALMSGRIADIAMVPDDPGTWYVAAGSGGVWKTVNSGTTWQPIFTGEGSYSVGCLTIDPHQPKTIWVGSGENVSGRHVGYGDGVYRSRDGGMTWENLGLKESEHIGIILVHPEDPNVVYVAAQGPLWSAGGERGLYLSTDGGANWEKVLGGGEYTGVNEVVMDPFDSNVLYASTWQRFRDVAALMDGGPESGIHKSTDGGRTWRELTAGLPTADMGKIGLAASPQQSGVLYAAIELGARKGGFWRSTDGGESWAKRSDKVAGGTGPHYYTEIFASPHAFDLVYFMEVNMSYTDDGGKTFQPVGEKHKHVDNHALAFSPTDPDYLLAGCDGGIYESWDRGKNWKFAANLPLTQFYKVAVDYDEPFYHIIGGTQDNNTQYGPSRTDNVHGLRNADWRVTLFGDGHQPAIDPTNPDIIYSSLQQCNHWRVDRGTGEVLPIRPAPGADEPEDRWNWDGPILISRHDPARLYVASQRLWRSDDRGDSWRAVSGDLTRDEDRLLRPMMGRVWSIDAAWDLVAMSMYGTITNIAESPLDENLLYVGTDDGLIQVSEDGGATWREAGRPKGLPDHFYVNDLTADRFDRNTVYAVIDLHKAGDFRPLVYRSTNAGKSWESIVGDLPERHIVWRLVQDTVKPDLLFLGTEFGIFVTVDGGTRWVKLQGGAPNIPFRDLVIQERENDLVGASFGRGFYVLDDYTPLREISEEALAEPALLFTPRRALSYTQRQVLGGNEKAAQGAAYFTAPNPPYGAVFTYFLKDSLQTAKGVRQDREKELAAEGEDTPYPGWEELRREELEDSPALVLTVRDEMGTVVRQLYGSGSPGLHRLAWDLRHANLRPETGPRSNRNTGGVPVAPGIYSVEVAKRQEGVLEPLAGPVTFEVDRLRDRSQPGMGPAELETFQLELAEFSNQVGDLNAVLNESRERLDRIKAALERAVHDDPELYTTAAGLEKRLEQLIERMRGHQIRSRYKDPGPASVGQRLRTVQSGGFRSTYGPTPMHLEQYEFAQEQFEGARKDLTVILDEELPALESALDAAGVPWTSGRRMR